MKKNSEIKKRAALAKERLKMGYWNRMLEEKKRMEENGQERRVIGEMQRDKFRRDEMRAIDIKKARAEEEMYRKVCAILDENPDETAPIGRLIDREYYRTLNEFGKQKYLLELCALFRTLSRRYELEKKNQA